MVRGDTNHGIKLSLLSDIFFMHTVQAAEAYPPVARLSEICIMLIRVNVVQVCDARDDDSSNAVG